MAKLYREVGGARLVHVFNCPILQGYDSPDGIEETPRIRYGKHIVCNVCKKMAYVSVAASDYEKNFKKYQKWFKGVDELTLAKLVFKKHAKFMISGDKLYVKVSNERFYLDFSLFDIDKVDLYHNNYNLKKRESGNDNFENCGYHKHELGFKKKDIVGNVLAYIIYYDFDEAKKVHEKTRKDSVNKREVLTEDDPAFWGFGKEG